MMVLSTLRRCVAVVVAAASASLPHAAHAQRRAPTEFTRQALLILEFEAGAGASRRLGKDAAEAVRERAEGLVSAREVQLLGDRGTVQRLELLGIRLDQPPAAAELEYIAKALRGDEYVVARVERDGGGGGGVRLTGELRLVRDRWTRHPLPAAAAPDLKGAADQLARAVVAARAQLVYQRRCENALRDGKVEDGLAAARQGVAAAPRGAFVRACLVSALAAVGVPASERLTAARELLAVDSLSRVGLEDAARAHDLLGQRAEAAAMWLRLAATGPEDPELAARVLGALLDGGNAAQGEPLAARAAAAHPDDMTLLRLLWRARHETQNWPGAAAIGESLLVKDTAARADSALYTRLALAHRSAGRPVRALELAARGVALFPGDARLYGVYAQLVRAEADTVVPRGLAAFPNSADLHALAARELRARGQAEEALAATRRAVELDSTLPQGVLAVAQAEFDLGRPDSALATLGRALGRGEGGQDTAAVAQFALAKGNALLRAANQTKARGDYERALRFFALADSARATAQSKFLLGAAALSAARAALDDAPKAFAGGAKDEGCALARLGAERLAAARAGLAAGQELAPDAARQYLGYVDQLGPFAEKQVAAFCLPSP